MFVQAFGHLGVGISEDGACPLLCYGRIDPCVALRVVCSFLGGSLWQYLRVYETVLLSSLPYFRAGRHLVPLVARSAASLRLCQVCTRAATSTLL